MSGDSYREISHQSWFSRLKNAIIGVLLGSVLFIAAFPVLFWNEGRTVKRKRALDEGAGVVVSVSAEKVEQANEGKLIYLTAQAETQETLIDPDFDVSVNAIRLKRDAQMYQWQEKTTKKTKKKVGGGTKTETTYTYTKTWSERLIDSSKFKKPAGHGNPANMPYKTLSINAQNVNTGAFSLSHSLIERINNFQSFPVDTLPGSSGSSGQKFHLHNGGYYIGANPNAPQIGDMKIGFQVVHPTAVSIVAKQIGNTFDPYKTESGGNIERLKVGTHSAATMFEMAQKENILVMWVLRVGGFLAMLIGLSLFFRPTSVFADVLPFLGSLVRTLSIFVLFFIAGALSFLTIGIAWVTYRPLIGVPLLIAAIILFVLSVTSIKRKKVTV